MSRISAVVRSKLICDSCRWLTPTNKAGNDLENDSETNDSEVGPADNMEVESIPEANVVVNSGGFAELCAVTAAAFM